MSVEVVNNYIAVCETKDSTVLPDFDVSEEDNNKLSLLRSKGIETSGNCVMLKDENINYGNMNVKKVYIDASAKFIEKNDLVEICLYRTLQIQHDKKEMALQFATLIHSDGTNFSDVFRMSIK